MAKQLDQIIVVDVESTCWKNSPPPSQVSEIIEIGICPLVVATGERLPKESILVKPEWSMVSEFCTQLTTLTQQQVDAGASFREAVGMLRKKHDTKLRSFASWGDYDRRQFQRQCESEGIPYPFGPTHHNIKSLFAIMRGLQRECSVEEAYKMLGWEFEGTLHRGDDDAFAIARIASHLLLERE